MATRVKEAVYQHLVHYGRTPDWLAFQAWWDSELMPQRAKRNALRCALARQNQTTAATATAAIATMANWQGGKRELHPGEIDSEEES